ncbi:MAG: CheR family methyltransferase [Campylobacterota bacterium]|nr:CheR family methyltransferase [Campylobacterota bacterium]
MMGFFDWLSKEEEIVEEICIEKKSNFSNFKKVTDFIYEESGITDLDKRALTSSRAQQHAISKDVYTTDDFLSKMKSDREFYQDIINIATVNETFFLREVKELEWLVRYIKEENRPLSILSMPSSSGEEIYSILLMLSDEGFDIDMLEIRGYDINSYAVACAKSGEYDEHSLHKIDGQRRAKYFSAFKEHFQISAEFRNRSIFEQKNIFDLANQTAKYDIILSRNMFIYFDDKKREIALNIITNMLKTNGIYIKGHADHIKKHPKLESVEYGIYKKI